MLQQAKKMVDAECSRARHADERGAQWNWSGQLRYREDHPRAVIDQMFNYESVCRSSGTLRSIPGAALSPL
jgi:hypothetical protein